MNRNTTLQRGSCLWAGRGGGGSSARSGRGLVRGLGGGPLPRSARRRLDAGNGGALWKERRPRTRKDTRDRVLRGASQGARGADACRRRGPARAYTAGRAEAGLTGVGQVLWLSGEDEAVTEVPHAPARARARTLSLPR